MKNSNKFKKDIINFNSKFRYFLFFVGILITISNLLLSFALPFATESFKKGHHRLAIIILCIYLMDGFIRSFIGIFERRFFLKYKMMIDVEVNKRSINILNVVRNKVYTNDNNKRRRLNTIEIQENTNEYIFKNIEFRNEIIKNIIAFIFFVVLVLGSIITTMLTIDNLNMLLGIISFCFIATIIITIRQIKARKVYFRESRKLSDELNVKKFDMLNVKAINERHFNFVSKTYDKRLKEKEMKNVKISTKDEIGNCIKNAILSLSVTVLIIFAFFSYEEVNIEIFLTVVALSGLYSKVLLTLTKEISNIQSVINLYTRKESYKDTFDKIINKYIELVSAKTSTEEKIEKVTIKDLQFVHEDQEKKVIHKITAESMIFEFGQIILLSGVSGSGKSTLLNILSGEYTNDNYMVINDKFKSHSLYNTITYDTTSCLGNMSVLQELTFTEDKNNIDYEKLIHILKELDIYELLITKAKGECVFDYMSNIYQDSFSAGQLQRLIICRLLYNLDKNVNVVIFDEPTANLDIKTAEKVAKFVCEFCNKDTKRIVFIASHQRDVVKKYSDVEYNFKRINEDSFEIIQL